METNSETDQQIQNIPNQPSENMPEFTITKIPHIEREQNIKYRKKTFVSPKKSIRQKTREDPRLTETFKIIQDI